MARMKTDSFDFDLYWRTEEKIMKRKSRKRNDLIRCLSSRYIQKENVRDIILERHDFMCTNCGLETNLQVDHIIPVYILYKKDLVTMDDMKKINNLDNLQILCGDCNLKKSCEAANQG